MVNLEIHATPGSRRNAIGGSHEGCLRVRVTAPAEKGKANEAIIRLLAKELGVPKSAVRLVSGQGSRKKRYAIEGDAEKIQQRARELMSGV